MDIKQVIVMRKDLNMRKGKMVAQGAHASMKVILDMGKNLGGKMEIPLSESTKYWLETNFKKICLSVDSEDELLNIYNQALERGIPTTLIEDSGLTEFNGIKTKTCIAIGPHYSADIDKITGGLKLL